MYALYLSFFVTFVNGTLHNVTTCYKHLKCKCYNAIVSFKNDFWSLGLGFLLSSYAMDGSWWMVNFVLKEYFVLMCIFGGIYWVELAFHHGF